MFFNTIENILVLICTIFAYFLKVFHYVCVIISKICEFASVLLIFLGAGFIIKNLEPDPQGIVLLILILGSAICFLSFMILAIWRKDKFNKILDIISG